MKLHFSAGSFDIETWTDSHPMWMELSYRGEKLAPRFHHSDLKDLMFVLDRMKNAAQSKMPDPYKPEFD